MLLVTYPLYTCCCPLARPSAVVSFRIVCNPLSTLTWAIPAPIRPAPKMARVLLNGTKLTDSEFENSYSLPCLNNIGVVIFTHLAPFSGVPKWFFLQATWPWYRPIKAADSEVFAKYPKFCNGKQTKRLMCVYPQCICVLTMMAERYYLRLSQVACSRALFHPCLHTLN